MKVTHLFAVGKSIRTVKDEPSPYKVANTLPKLRGEMGKPVSERTTGDSEVLARPAETVEVEEVHSAEEPAIREITTKERKSVVLPGWSMFRRRLAKSRGQTEQLVQPELCLETVRVMRNDLQDHDTQQVKRTNPFKARQTVTVAGHWWTRLQTRLFARTRKQD